jgi:hypothetical protein
VYEAFSVTVPAASDPGAIVIEATPPLRILAEDA